MSQQTTNLGPQVSMGTSHSHGGLSVGTFVFPSWVTADFDGSVDATDGAFYPRSVATTESLTSLNIQDGELVIGVNEASLTTLYYRSGVTTYQFASDATTVL